MTETSSKFEIGDQIEFCSGENSGMWKTEVVAPIDDMFNPYAKKKGWTTMIRIQVGDNVCIIRPASKCRRPISE